MLAKEKWQIGTVKVLERVFEERKGQVAKYGHNEDIEDGTGPETRWLLPFTSLSAEKIEADLRADYEAFEEETGKPTWAHLVREELAEAFMEEDDQRLIEELTQVAALCVSWMEKIQKRLPR